MTAPTPSWPVWGAILALLAGAAEAECLSDNDGIATDRPNGPNSSAVVPPGSVQFENGAGVARSQGTTTFDLPETRGRFGIVACTEFLVDLPGYTQNSHGPSGAGFIAPAIKHQFENLPAGLAMWGTVGVTLPTGDEALSGRGPVTYLQVPATYELGYGMSVDGMYSVSFPAHEINSKSINQSSVSLGGSLADNSDLFIEYINSYQRGASTQSVVDFGGSYRSDPLRQLDFKLGGGLNHASPDWYFTLGYSFRLDHIFDR